MSYSTVNRDSHVAKTFTIFGCCGREMHIFLFARSILGLNYNVVKTKQCIFWENI